MDIATAQLLGRHLLAGRRLDQRRTAQKDGAPIPDDDVFVGHGRHIRPAGRTRAHDHGDLGDALGRHAGLVVKDPAEVLTVGKNIGLERQVGPAGVHQVDARQPVLLGNLLGAQMFF